MFETNRRKSGCGCLPIIGAAVLLAIGGAYFYFRFRVTGKELTPLEAAKVVPQEALMTSFISTDPKDWSKLEQFGTPEAQKLIGESMDNLQEGISVQTEIDYEKDIKPWLGGVMFALLPSDESVSATDEYNMLMVVGIKHKLKALDFVNKLKNKEGQQIQESDYKGITIVEVKIEDNGATNLRRDTLYSKRFSLWAIEQIMVSILSRFTLVADNGIYSAVLGDRLVLSSERETVELAIDTFKGKPSFASKEGADKIFSQRLDIKNPIAKIYLADCAGVIQQATLSAPKGVEILSATLKQLEQVELVVMGVGIDDQGVRFQAIAKLNPEAIQQEFKPAKGKVLSQFPADTIALISGQGISEGWSQFVALIWQFFDQSVNLDADKDVFGWMDGEFALGIIASNQGSLSDTGLGGAMILETSDRQTGQKTLEKLDELVELDPFISLNQRSVQGTKVTEWITPQQEVVLAHGWIKKNSLLITLGAPFANVMNTQPKTSLAQSKNFKTITGYLPKNNLGYFYLDMEKAMSVRNNLPQAQGNLNSPEANAVPNSIRGIAVTATMPDKSTSQVDMLLFLEPMN